MGGSCDIMAENSAEVKKMLSENSLPILEFDDCKTAKINPQTFAGQPFDTDKLVITFFPEVLDRLIAEGAIVHERTISGENPVVLYRFADSDVLILLGAIGCPACAGNLDLLNGMGIEKVMFCGGGGVLDRKIEVGQLLLVEEAIRDEGFSYHYIEPSRTIRTDPAITAKIAAYLDEHSVSYLRGITWTTDALFRETAERIERRRAEGAQIVEMEQAGCIAVAQFRGFAYGALIYGGDDVSGQEWDNRSWRSRKGIRHDMVMLCKQLVQII